MCTIQRPAPPHPRSRPPYRAQRTRRRKSDPARPEHIAAPFGGSVTPVAAAGDQVEAGDIVAKIEAMKMEASITTPVAGTVARIALAGAAQVDGGDLIMVIS